MRGTILGFDAATGQGVINDAAGNRVKFSRDAWKGSGEPVAGRQVDFDAAGGVAEDIYPVPGMGSALNFSMGDDKTKSALVAGWISLGCAIATWVLQPLFFITLPVSIIFGIKGKNEGALLEDKTAYYLSMAGLVISGLTLLLAVLLLATCVSGVAWLGASGWWWH